MSDNIVPGLYRIISLVEGDAATSVNFTHPASQTVRLKQEVQNWMVRREGHKIKLSVGGYPYTGVEDDKVTASIHSEIEREWHVTHREIHRAYTIEPADNSDMGWTVVDGAIEIRLLTATHSWPPQYKENQLYRLIQIN